jgi:hypothetical protein
VGVHVAEVVRAHRATGRPERPRRHRRAEVRAADADVQHVGEALAGGAEQPAVLDGGAERLHPLQHRANIGRGVLGPRAEPRRARRPQRHVQHGAALRRVHRLAGGHGGALAFEVGGACQVEQGGQGLVGDRGLGQVEQQAVGTAREAVEAFGGRREQRADGVRRAPVRARPRR